MAPVKRQVEVGSVSGIMAAGNIRAWRNTDVVNALGCADVVLSRLSPCLSEN